MPVPAGPVTLTLAISATPPSITALLVVPIVWLATHLRPTTTPVAAGPVTLTPAISATFDHSAIGGADCVACHAPPANHYAGTCRACHADTGNFRNATFDHSVIGGTDCGACHNPPGNHYPGECRSCHVDTGNFHNVNFSHAGLTDCRRTMF
jgi:hypothetical protein